MCNFIMPKDEKNYEPWKKREIITHHVDNIYRIFALVGLGTNGREG